MKALEENASWMNRINQDIKQFARRTGYILFTILDNLIYTVKGKEKRKNEK